MSERGTPRQIWPMVFGQSVFALAAVGIAAFMLAAGRADTVLIVGAVFLLASGQVALVIGLSVRTLKLEQHASELAEDLHLLVQQSQQSETRLAEAERLVADPSRGKFDELMADVRSLRDSVRQLMAPARPEPQAATDIRWHAGQPSAAQAKAPPPRAPASPAKGEAQRLDLLLEPIIELSTGSTSHYRAMLDLAGGNGHVVQHDELMQKADEGGMRPALDIHMLKQVVPVLRRLRKKTPGMRAFVHVGVPTLQSRGDLDRLVAMLEAEADVVRGIVFELTHRELGDLGEHGAEGLARLARLGATLSLAGVQVAGLDLAALRQLGVRFLSFPPSAADAGFGMSPAWREFVQYARAMQFQIVMSDIQTTQQAEAAKRIGRFAHGPFYAPPRKVKPDAGVSAILQRTASAA